MDKFLYYVDGKPYLNITNKCSNACDFCIRCGRKTMDGQDLWLNNQTPSAQEIIKQLKAEKNLQQEFVFCGFGEPTENLDAYIKVAEFIKLNGGKVRLNTNGQSDLINGFDTTETISAVTDSVSISLNEDNAEDYHALCHSRFGAEAYSAMLKFAKNCADKGVNVIMSVVDVIGEEKIAKCKQICKQIGVTLKVRKYIPLSQY